MIRLTTLFAADLTQERGIEFDLLLWFLWVVDFAMFAFPLILGIFVLLILLILINAFIVSLRNPRPRQ
jgi:hypothetical protein